MPASHTRGRYQQPGTVAPQNPGTPGMPPNLQPHEGGRRPPHPRLTPAPGSRCEEVALGLGASASSDGSRGWGAPMAYGVTAVTPAIHTCTPRRFCEDQLYPGDRCRVGPTLTVRAPQKHPHPLGRSRVTWGRRGVSVGYTVSPQSDILPSSSLVCDTVRLGEGRLGLGCRYKKRHKQGECGGPRGPRSSRARSRKEQEEPTCAGEGREGLRSGRPRLTDCELSLLLSRDLFLASRFFFLCRGLDSRIISSSSKVGSQ